MFLCCFASPSKVQPAPPESVKKCNKSGIHSKWSPAIKTTTNVRIFQATNKGNVELQNGIVPEISSSGSESEVIEEILESDYEICSVKDAVTNHGKAKACHTISGKSQTTMIQIEEDSVESANEHSPICRSSNKMEQDCKEKPAKEKLLGTPKKLPPLKSVPKNLPSTTDQGLKSKCKSRSKSNVSYQTTPSETLSDGVETEEADPSQPSEAVVSKEQLFESNSRAVTSTVEVINIDGDSTPTSYKPSKKVHEETIEAFQNRRSDNAGKNSFVDDNNSMGGKSLTTPDIRFQGTPVYDDDELQLMEEIESGLGN